MEKDIKAFDEKAKAALELLMEQFWILRETQPEEYQLIREREHSVRRYVEEKLGFRFIVHQHFIKLEKIPSEPESWMGITSFRSTMDYAMFCCLLGFLESRSVDEQFLLSDLTEELSATYPGVFQLNWTHYEHRKSLIRIIQSAMDFGILKSIDGDIKGFQFNEKQEVLYEVPIVSRYFMRSYPKDLFQFNSIEELIQYDKMTSSNDERRHHVYRQLFLSPAMYRKQQDDPNFHYLRNFRNRLKDDIEKHTDYQFELYKNAAMLISPEKKQKAVLFPDQKAIMDIVLQFSDILRQAILQFPPNDCGLIRITATDFESLLEECSKQFSTGWSKAYREASLKQLARELLTVMGQWKMAELEEETGMIFILPLLGRLTGKYPDDFQGGERDVTK